MLSSGHTSGGGIDGPGVFHFSVEFAVAQRQVALLEVFEDDVSEGEGYPPPRVVVPVIILRLSLDELPASREGNRSASPDCSGTRSS